MTTRCTSVVIPAQAGIRFTRPRTSTVIPAQVTHRVIPAQAGTQSFGLNALDSRLRWNDDPEAPPAAIWPTVTP